MTATATINDTTAGRTDALTFEFDFPHKPEKVWRALTDPSLLAQWLLPAIGYRLERGAQFQFKTEPVGGWDGVVDCEVADVIPMKTLSYSWGVGSELVTRVTFTLTPTPTGTHMSLIQSGFREDQKKNLGGARYGWKTMGGKLIDLLEKTS